MNPVLLKSVVALLPACILLIGAVSLFIRAKSMPAFLQSIGAGFLVIVVLTHVCEALRLFAWMHWGAEHSFAHYLDVSSAILGLVLFPIGYLLYVIRQAA